jgi:hypothetical protein
MNIFISPFSNDSFYYRPDSTLIRTLDEYYVPDYVSQIGVIPIQYVRIEKPIKYIDKKYVHRYIDSFGCGILLSPTISNNFNPFLSNSLDFTTIIPLEHTMLKDNYSIIDKDLDVRINGKSLFSNIIFTEEDTLYSIIAEISRYCSIKIGDFVACELAKRESLSIGDHVEILSQSHILNSLIIK